MHFEQRSHHFSESLPRLLAVVVIHLLLGSAIVAGLAVRHKTHADPLPPPVTALPPDPIKPVDPPPIDDLPTLNPPPIQQMPVTIVETLPPDTITQPHDPLPQPPTVKSGSGGTSLGGDGVKPVVAKAKPVLGKGSCETPAYPVNAAREGATGTVRLALLVGVNGRVTDSRIEKTSGHRELDKAARTALSMCRFTPAMVDGVAEPMWTVMEYIWTLDN